jgi:ubiquinone/menaquinone biosynthesis C-methylase UbiE
MVARAGRGLAQAGVIWARADVGSAEEIPCDAASFDTVLSNGALNLSPDKERAFRDIYRVLRPGGRLQFADIVQSGRVPREAAGDPDAWSQ